MRPVNEIIVHCSATRREWMADKSLEEQIDEIRRWHVNGNGWSDIGYHYVIGRNGRVLPARPLERVGAHVKGHNTGTIGICLIGGHGSAETDQFLDHFTKKQDETLRTVIDNLMIRYPSIKKVSGHNQYSAKACPGFFVPEWFVTKPEPPAKPCVIFKSIRNLLKGK